MEKPTCATCPFWDLQYKDLAIGECRAHAPQTQPNDDDDIWPSTAAKDWCGEHPLMNLHVLRTLFNRLSKTADCGHSQS